MAEGIGPGDEVITTPFTFFATAGSVSRVGARPVFVDVDPVTYNIDVTKVAAAITPRTRAIIPVHLYGQMADMDAVMQIASDRRLMVIEDAAQAIGAELKGRRAGSIGHYGCLSFFPSKNLGAGGDAGMVVTNDSAKAEKLIRLRNHGAKSKYDHALIGGNFRLDAIQAAIVSAKLPHLDHWTTGRQRNADRYNRLFLESGVRVADTAAVSRTRPRFGVTSPQVYLPKVACDRHVFNQYVIRVEHRDELKTALASQGVSTEIYYPTPMHRQECYRNLNLPAGTFPESETAAQETLALPIYPELSDDQAAHVVQSIAHFCE
jgi:dTDP-4-amino-4,6-dideoxygalactose transaminase